MLHAKREKCDNHMLAAICLINGGMKRLPAPTHNLPTRQRTNKTVCQNTGQNLSG